MRTILAVSDKGISNLATLIAEMIDGVSGSASSREWSWGVANGSKERLELQVALCFNRYGELKDSLRTVANSKGYRCSE